MDSAVVLFDGSRPLDIEELYGPSPLADSERVEAGWLGIPRRFPHRELVGLGRENRKEKRKHIVAGTQVAKWHSFQAEHQVQIEPQIAVEVKRLLPIVGDFVPSSALTDIWHENLRNLEHDPNVQHRFFLGESTSKAALNTDLRETIEKSLAALANRSRHQQIRRMTLIKNLSFTPSAEFGLIDRLYLVPSLSGRFFERLARELTSFLRSQGAISATWGELRSTSEGAEFFLAGVPKKESRVKARVVR